LYDGVIPISISLSVPLLVITWRTHTAVYSLSVQRQVYYVSYMSRIVSSGIIFSFVPSIPT